MGYDEETDRLAAKIAGFVVVLAVVVAASIGFGTRAAELLFEESPDHGATAWGYVHRLNVVNTDCTRAPVGYACQVVLSTGPSRFVLCKNEVCEEVVSQ